LGASLPSSGTGLYHLLRQGASQGTEPLARLRPSGNDPIARLARRSPDNLTPDQSNKTQPTHLRPVFSGIDAAVETLGGILAMSAPLI
jgi:hypothetical protein